MENLGKKVGYLKGLMEGLDFSDDPSKGRLLTAMVELLGDLSDRVEGVEELMDDLNDYVESIDDDLADLEETLFGDDEELEDGCHCGCEDGDCDCEDEDCDCEDDEDDLISYACPHCGHEIEFHASDVDFDEDYLCPACGKPVLPELEEDEDGGEDDKE